FPVHEYFQQWAMENGVDLEGAAISRFLSEGILDMAIESFTGQDFNVSERYGPGGLSILPDLLSGNFFEVFSGASGSFIGEVLQSTQPFAYKLVNVFNPEADGYNLQPNDILNVARSLSTVNNLTKAYLVHSAGRWETRAGSLQMEQEAGDLGS